jgi:hypothetical protein
MRPACVKCRVEFRCKKNGFMAVTMAGLPPQPYQIWSADMWECPGCKVQILSGFSRIPIAENWQENFHRWLDGPDPKVEVFEKVEDALSQIGGQR